MNGFAAASLVEHKGMGILLPYLEERSYNGRIVRTTKGTLARYLQEVLGDVLLNTDEHTVWAAEIKVEQRFTGNLFLETWSNRNLDSRSSHAERGCNRGWLDKLRADILLYYFVDFDWLFSIPVFELKQWAFGTSEKKARLYDFEERGQKRYSQMNDTLGRLVPVNVLKKEIPMKRTSVRQLSMVDVAA